MSLSAVSPMLELARRAMVEEAVGSGEEAPARALLNLIGAFCIVARLDAKLSPGMGKPGEAPKTLADWFHGSVTRFPFDAVDDLLAAGLLMVMPTEGRPQ